MKKAILSSNVGESLNFKTLRSLTTAGALCIVA